MPQIGVPCCFSVISTGASCTQGMHQEAKKLISVGRPMAAMSALEKPWLGGWPGSEKLGSGLPISMLGTPCGS